MAGRNEIAEEIERYRSTGQDLVRRKYLRELSEYTGNDTIVYAATFVPHVPGISGELLSLNSNDIQGLMTCLHGLSGDKLDLVLHSPGGSLEVTEQIVQYLRAKYNYIRAIVPQNAMSAATMLACACDEIVMGKQSAIGPIDPQITIPNPNGSTLQLPAYSILEDFETAKREIAQDQGKAAVWLPKVMQIPIGTLDYCKKSIEVSKEKVETWLGSYMFHGEAPEIASSIAAWLGDYQQHKTHGRPIAIDLARAKGLKVVPLEDDQELQERVLSVFHAIMLTFESTACVKIIENHDGKGSFTVASLAQIPVPVSH